MEANDEKILYLLKSRGPQTAAVLAETLGITAVGVRQHLAQLKTQGLVMPQDRRESVGRPKRYWQLSQRAQARFPDSHAQLSLELLQATRTVFGDEGLEQLIAWREQKSLTDYQRRLESCATLAERVAALAELRAKEGYMAEWQRQPDGSFLLLENHCPICAAASQCQGLCRSELAIFRQVLGPNAAVERVEYLLSGARRCAYKITPTA